jgi:hypothetical protein
MKIIDRVKNIIISPATEWAAIEQESSSLQQLVITYLIPLALLGTAATFIRWGLMGVSILSVHFGGISWGLSLAIQFLVRIIVGAIITTYVVDALAPTFKSEKNVAKSAQLVIYSYTPMLLGSILMIIPVLGVIGALFGLYGLYLLYTGVHVMKKTPEEQKIGYIVVAILVLVAVHFVIGMILGSLFGSMFGIGMYNHFSM